MIERVARLNMQFCWSWTLIPSSVEALKAEDVRMEEEIPGVMAQVAEEMKH